MPYPMARLCVRIGGEKFNFHSLAPFLAGHRRYLPYSAEPTKLPFRIGVSAKLFDDDHECRMQKRAVNPAMELGDGGLDSRGHLSSLQRLSLHARWRHRLRKSRKQI